MSDVLISHEQIDTSITGAIAHRIRCRSHDLHGRPTESTGLVIAPIAAGENRRVMSWAHGTTGLGDAGSPSAQPDPARELTLYFAPGSKTQIDYGIPGLQAFIDDGWVVVATDYRGLGGPGVHQYTVNRTNGIDAVCMSPGVPSIALKLPGMGSALGGDDIPHEGQVMILAGTKMGAWVQAFNDASAAQRKPVAPVLVQIDRQMEDGPCPVPWQLGYIDAITELGGDISSTSYPDDDHFSLPHSAIGEAMAWLAARF